MAAIPSLDNAKGTRALRGFLLDLAQRMRAGAQEHHATGALGSSVTSEITVIGPSGASGRILALDYWHQVGSGSPPGTHVNTGDLIPWVKIKGLALTDKKANRLAFLISRKIEALGSFDWRTHGENVFLREIDASQDGLSVIGEAYMDDIDDITIRQFKDNLAA